VRQEQIKLTHQIFKSRKSPVAKSYLLERLECSESTLKRIFSKLRNDYNAPLHYQFDQRGYCYTDERFELNLPGLWSSPEALLALVSIQKLLAQMQLDILDEHLQSLKQEIQQYLKRKKIQTNQIDRIRILPITARISNTKHFQQVASALLQRQTLKINYHARADNQVSTRVISPQRLAHYKDNWYLDAWCHMRSQLRTFALDRMQTIENDTATCQSIAEAVLDQHLASGYGIFAGEAKQSATLLFSANRARWVAEERWHPNQQSTWLGDGRYQLQIPYADERELLMDIMRHLPEVEIVAPTALKQKLTQVLKQSLQQHKNDENN
jgi:proteasome accessory factor C